MFITVQDPNTPPTPRWRWINQFTMFWRRWSHRSGCLHRSDSRRNLNTRKTCWFKSADVWQNFWLGFFYLKLSDFKQRFWYSIEGKDISSHRCCWALCSLNLPDIKTLSVLSAGCYHRAEVLQNQNLVHWDLQSCCRPSVALLTCAHCWRLILWEYEPLPGFKLRV